MSTLWKVVLGLAVLLPLAGYVAGSLVTSAADEPAPRETIVVRQDPAGTGAGPSPAGATPGAKAEKRDEGRGDDGKGGRDGRGGRNGRDGDDSDDRDDDDGVRPVAPQPAQVGGDDDGDGDDGGDDDADDGGDDDSDDGDD